MKRLDPAPTHLISISRLRTRNGTEVSSLRLRGAVVPETEEEFQKRLEESAGRSAFVIVDLSELDAMSPAGVGLLLRQARRQEAAGGWLRVAARPPAARDLTGIADALPVFASEEEAVRGPAPRAA